MSPGPSLALRLGFHHFSDRSALSDDSTKGMCQGKNEVVGNDRWMGPSRSGEGVCYRVCQRWGGNKITISKRTFHLH